MRVRLRRSLLRSRALLLQVASVAVFFLVWTACTWGEPEQRLLSPLAVLSPRELLGQIHSLWFDAALSRSTAWSLWRILLGFGLAAVTAGISEIELSRRVRRAKPGLLVVDYLQLMTSARRPDRKDLEIANITAGLKGIAKELHIPVILLSQLNREVEKRANGRPMLCDLRESGAIEQDADLVFGLYQDPGTPGTVDLICLKHRNGPLGTVTVAFQGEVCGFKALETT